MSKIKNPDKHFADLVNLFAVLDTLPDTDIILLKAGIGIAQLRNLMNDSQVETVWNTRLAGVTGAGFSIEPGGDSPASLTAAKFVRDMVQSYDFPTIISGMMDAVAFGFSPVEIIWNISGKKWLASEFVPKPPEWFCFSSQKKLLFRSKASFSGVPVPENKFILVQNRPSYQNPYGTKLFSRIYWPVTFKRNGIRWWTMFLEKFGSPFIYGKYSKGSSNADKTDLLDALENMLSNSVAVGPDDTDVDIKGDTTRSQAGTVHERFYKAQNIEIAKAILGQTLSSDIGDAGSRAAAEVHYKVKADIALADQRLIAGAFNKLFALVTLFNFGHDTPPPLFVFAQMEELHRDRAERDKVLYDMGTRFSPEYIADHYGIDPRHIDVTEPSAAENNGFSSQTAAQHFSRCESSETVEDFTSRLEKSGQDEIDSVIDEFQSEIDKSRSFEDAQNRISKRYQRQFKRRLNLTRLLDNLRYVAASAGASNAKK